MPTDRSRKPYARPEARPKADDGMWVHDKAPGAGRKRGLVAQASTPSAPSSAPGQATRLQVSNLHYEITPADLSSIFGQIGTLVKQPELKYDRSGRSTGTAIVSFETAGEATRAKNQYNGVLAKGQPMEVSYDMSASRPRLQRVSSAPSSLLQRVAKVPLADRLTRDDTATVKKSTASKAAAPESTNGGPVRSGRGRGGRGAKPARTPKKALTAEDLDKELDAFMVDDTTATAPMAAPAAEAAMPAGDVEMAA